MPNVYITGTTSFPKTGFSRALGKAVLPFIRQWFTYTFSSSLTGVGMIGVTF